MSPLSIRSPILSPCAALSNCAIGAVLHGLPVRVIGVGGGYAYGQAGPTHHSLEDLCICRALTGLRVVATG